MATNFLKSRVPRGKIGTLAGLVMSCCALLAAASATPCAAAEPALRPLIIAPTALSLPDSDVYQPLPDASGTPLPPLLLVLAPGANRPASEYQELARATQRAAARANIALWVGVLKFSQNFPNPLEMAPRVKSVSTRVRKLSGGALGLESTFLAGHSLAGIFGKDVVLKQKLAGLILLGSYLPHTPIGGASLTRFEAPVLTLAGELDGQTRLTRIAAEAAELQNLLAQNPEKRAELIQKKPVVVLSGVNHAQFANGQATSEDLEPEASTQEAHATIASTMVAFMVANNAPGSALGSSSQALAQASDLLDAAVTASFDFTNAWQQAKALESNWCMQTQLESVRLNLTSQTLLSIGQSVQTQLPAFAFSKPNMQTDGRQTRIEVSVLFDRPFNPIDISRNPEAATQIACKMKSQEALLAASQDLQVIGAQESCATQNARAFNWALQAVGDTPRARYLQKGIPLEFASDKETQTGITWLPQSLSFAETLPSAAQPNTKKRVVVQSPALNTNLQASPKFAGMHYCKLLSPTRAMEWILVDGLRP